MRERDVGGDDDVTARDPFRDPIIGSVGTAADDNPLDQGRSRNSHGAVADDVDLDGIPLSHAIDFCLYRACVGIDVNSDRLGRLGQCCAPFETKS